MGAHRSQDGFCFTSDVALFGFQTGTSHGALEGETSPGSSDVAKASNEKNPEAADLWEHNTPGNPPYTKV